MRFLILLFIVFPFSVSAQSKKSLDHSVYDSWQAIGERLISNNGRWVVYTITPQEGDATLYIQPAGSAESAGLAVPRGYNALITEDSRYVVFRIKPQYAEIRKARIAKKKPEEMPRDSFAVVELGKDKVWKEARVKGYKTPKEGSGWVAYHREPVTRSTTVSPTQRTVDSLRKTIDSLVLLVREIKQVKGGTGADGDADEEPGAATGGSEGSDLVLRHLETGREVTFAGVTEYAFDKAGRQLVVRGTAPGKKAWEKQAVILYHLASGRRDTLLQGANSVRGLSFSDDGQRVAFLAERDTTKALVKHFGLYLYERGAEGARLLLDQKSVGMPLGMTVSEHGPLSFSKSGNRLFFGTAYTLPPKDTSLVEIDQVKLDIWHYKDDYLQSQQLFQLQNELKRHYPAFYDLERQSITQLGSKWVPNITITGEGDGRIFYGVTDTGRRVEAQWTGTTRKDIYAVDALTGRFTLVRKNHMGGGVYPAPSGNYLLVYDQKSHHYQVWDGKTWKAVSGSIKAPLYHEEYDMPNDPPPYGLMGWQEGDAAVYVYDRYDIWKLDPRGAAQPVNLTRGRAARNSYRYINTDPDEPYIRNNRPLSFRRQNEGTKLIGYTYAVMGGDGFRMSPLTSASAENAGGLVKAKDTACYLYTKESFRQSPDLFLYAAGGQEQRLTATNPQQALYNWGTAELFTWKTFSGKSSEGILYKPEDFDSTKKYPMIIYFYERLSDGLYNYIAPAPTPSRLNIPFFVSRGYLVFAPDIAYTKGHPARDAYNYIVSGAQALARKRWVDAKNMAVQGQSWGGYQVLALLVQTHMFKAAWAGAPVANMFSAYGGIRWESGSNRQFQYEKGQSRIGATPWEQPQLYMENSPLFHLTRIRTPLVIMSNDADGAVPWYQGIELFTALRRLNQPVWMLNYNGEAHNLVERKNRKDIQVRQQQYFDWLLKGAEPARWITEGVPAVRKGRDWGL